MIECSICGNQASFVLVNYNHEVIGDGITYCEQHAFDEGREECPCCDSYSIEVEDDQLGQRIELLPTYPAGTLDQQGCCSEHP